MALVSNLTPGMRSALPQSAALAVASRNSICNLDSSHGKTRDPFAEPIVGFLLNSRIRDALLLEGRLAGAARRTSNPGLGSKLQPGPAFAEMNGAVE